MTNVEMNKAIIKVATTQFKKDAKEAHAVVEAAGYKIKKYNGSFMIVNEDTNKAVYIQYPKSSYRAKIMGNYMWKKDMDWKDEKFDFVGYLNKPINEAWRKVQWEENYAPVMEKYRRLKSARWSVQYHEDNLERIKKQIEKLQNEIMYHAVRLNEEKKHLTDLKRELGIKK